MRIDVIFKNPKTGELRKVKCGWSWTLFFFAAFMGLPLFLRNLNGLGVLLLVLWFVGILAAGAGGLDGYFMIALIQFGFEIWLAAKGNEMTAKNYLEHGWVFAEPDTTSVQYAKGKWGISI